MELPTITSEDDGKTLVVENGAWALGNASGESSGGGVFVVRMTSLDESTFELDKTWQEIFDAMQSKFCYVNQYDTQQSLITDVAEVLGQYEVVITQVKNSALSTVTFTASTANGYPTLHV